MQDRDWTSVIEFYDGLAEDYHLVYGDRWDEAMRHQGGALDALIRDRLDSASSVLDCSCGIGTQAIGLSLRGYEVTGTDISARSLQRAATTAQTLDTQLRTQVADFRDLSEVAGKFDVVISCDNAVPHLLDDTQIDLAVAQMFAKLHPGGLLVISTRDYDQALRQRPRTAPPLDISGPPRQIVVRLHEWDAPDSLLYAVRFLILTQQEGGWRITDHATRYRALPAAQLTDSAARAGPVDIGWLTATGAGRISPSWSRGVQVSPAQRPAPHEHAVVSRVNSTRCTLPVLVDVSPEQQRSRRIRIGR